MSSGSREVDWIYVEDVARGLELLGDSPAIEGSTLDLGSGSLVTVREVARTLGRIIDPELEIAFANASVLPEPKPFDPSGPPPLIQKQWDPQRFKQLAPDTLGSLAALLPARRQCPGDLRRLCRSQTVEERRRSACLHPSVRQACRRTQRPWSARPFSRCFDAVNIHCIDVLALAKNSANQCKVNPLGGNSNAALGPNDTATTTTSGASNPI